MRKLHAEPQSVRSLTLAARCAWQTWTSAASGAPAASRTAPTTPEVTSATARQDTDSTRTAAAATAREIIHTFCVTSRVWKVSRAVNSGLALSLLHLPCSLSDSLCVDVDECLAANGGCDHTCQNNAGSFQCFCRRGFRLDEDRQSCIRELAD